MKKRILVLFVLSACTTLPTKPLQRHTFPKKDVYFGNVSQPYTTLGLVRSRVDFDTLDVNHEENELCQNAFNKAAKDLLSMAKDKGAQAVIDLQSVVFLQDGRRETYPRAECSDDGALGQVLVQGIAIQWKNR